MAVIVKYIVVRNGEEKMTFATKKEADAHDKMLDIADNVFDFLESAKTKLTEAQLEEISLVMAQKREELMFILRGMNPKNELLPSRWRSLLPNQLSKKPPPLKKKRQKQRQK